jgi:hypothetical protein
MTSVKEIESAIEKLAKDELTAFREWYEEFDAKLWDKQFEEDISSGKLDVLANAVLDDYRTGKCKEI